MNMKRVMADIERTLFYSDVGPGSGIAAGRSPLEKRQDALTKLIIPEFDSRGIAAFPSLPHAFVDITGDDSFRGIFCPEKCSKELRSCGDFNSSSFTYLLGNTLSMYLSKAYKSFPYREEILISEKKPAKDFKLIDSIQLGYFGDTPDIDPETQDYDDMGAVEDTRSQYRIGQKGAIVWITRYLIQGDQIDVIKSLISRQARSARMTHAKYVWNFYINNATCPDETAWFTGGHGNLGSNALDIAPLVTAITALANMEEPGSGEKLGLDLASFDWNLVLPIDLWDIGVRKNQKQSYYTLNDLTEKVSNACYRLFGDRNERIVTCPFMTDTNDWGVIRNKEDVPIVEMSYLHGKEDPEFIVHQGPTDGMVFKSDKIGYKIRHEYGGVLAGYQGGYKSIVT